MAGITIDGNSNIVSYTVSENATSKTPTESTGGFGQLTYTIQETDDVESRLETDTVLFDPFLGEFQGIIRDLSATDGLLSVTGDSILSKLQRWYTIPPFQGSLQGYLNTVSNITGLPIYTTVSRSVVAPGFVGSVWDGLNDFLIANHLEMAQVAGQVIVRELRSFESYYNSGITESWSLNSQTTAEKLKVYWYNIQDSGNNIEVLTPDTVISVDAGEQLVQEFTIEGSLTRVNQPTVLDYVPANADFSGTAGAYCVAGNDGKPILADRWVAGGGSLRVELTADPSIIRVIITGSTEESYAPYRIAATAGSSSFYNSLHVTGDGLSWEKGDIEVFTGASREGADVELPMEYDNRNVTSLDQAYTMALQACKALCGGIKTISGTAKYLNRSEDRPNTRVPTFEDFDSEHAPMTFAQFDAFYSGDTFEDFDQYWDGKVKDTLENQAFGQVVGARARRDTGYYRVSSVTSTPNNVSYELETDTTFEDFDNHYGTMTFEDFDILFSGKRFMDFDNGVLK